MVAFGPVGGSGPGNLTSVNEVSLERCPGQAWMPDRQRRLPNRFHTEWCGSKWDTCRPTPPLPGRRLRASHPAATWGLRSHGVKTFVTEKICVCLLAQHFWALCKINTLGRMLLQGLHLQGGEEGMILWSELAKMKNYSGVSFLCCKLENSEMCGTAAEAQTSK